MGAAVSVLLALIVMIIGADEGDFSLLLVETFGY